MTAIPALYDEEEQEYGKVPSFFFALVIGAVGENQAGLRFDIRHSTVPATTLCTRNLPYNEENGQAPKDGQPLIVQMPAEKIFF